MSEQPTIAESVRDNIELVMSYHGWHDRDMLAKLEPPVANSTFNGWKTMGTTDVRAIHRLSQAIGWPLNVLAGFSSCPERDEMLAHRIWNPMLSEGAADFASTIRDYLGKAKQVLSLMQEVPCSWMSERVIDLMYDSYFSPVKSTAYGRKLKRQYKEFGQRQRERFCDSKLPRPKNMLALIPRCDFEKLVRRQRPFDKCSPDDVLDCLGIMRAHCQDGYIGFILIDTPSVNEIQEVRSAYSKVDSVVVVDNALTFRREIESIAGGMFPRLLRWSTDTAEVAKAKAIVSKFIKAGVSNYQKMTLAELDNYEKILDT